MYALINVDDILLIGSLMATLTHLISGSTRKQHTIAQSSTEFAQSSAESEYRVLASTSA